MGEAVPGTCINLLNEFTLVKEGIASPAARNDMKLLHSF
jgi:hypothetical protein